MEPHEVKKISLDDFEVKETIGTGKINSMLTYWNWHKLIPKQTKFLKKISNYIFEKNF